MVEQKTKPKLSKLTLLGLLISTFAFSLACGVTFVDLDCIWFVLFGGGHVLIWLKIALAEVGV